MITDGTEFGPFWARRVCCRGEILSKYSRIFPFPFPSKPGRLDNADLFYVFISQWAVC